MTGRSPPSAIEADANYKATRKGMPEELAHADAGDEAGAVRHVTSPATKWWATRPTTCWAPSPAAAKGGGWECVIVTGDRDSLQLITGRTTREAGDLPHGPDLHHRHDPCDLFREQYGFDPIHMIDLKALMGDSSDNIPGVPGIGEKTATALVQRYGSIDALYAAMPDVEAKPAALRKLAEGEESARRSYWLATIVTDAPLEFDPEDALRQPYRPELYDLFMKLEFTKLIEKYDLTPAAPTPEPAAPVHDEDYSVMIEVPQTDDDAARLLAQWRSVPHVTVYGLDDLRALAVECEIDDHHGLTVILRTDRFDGDWDALLRGLFSADIPKVAHNVKDMTYALLERGLPAEGFIFDTALAAYLLDATAGGYDLQRLFVAYCGAELPAPAHLARDAFAPLSDAATEEAALCSYTSAVSALYEILPGKLEELNLTALLHEMELPLCRVLAEMELAGFRIDECALAQFGIDLHERIVKLEQSIYDMAGEKFNINSPRQLGIILFDKLQLPHGKKTKTGWSTNAEVLEKLRYEAPIVEQRAGVPAVYEAEIHLRRRSAAGGVARQPDAHPVPDDRHSHRPSQLHGAESAEHPHPHPNWAAKFARLFVAEDGNVLVDADYSQIELRLLAHMAGRRSHAAGLPVRCGLPHRHGSQGVPRAGSGGDPRDAFPGQGCELRHRVRHVRLLPQSGYRRDGGGSQGLHGALLRHLPRREAVHDRYRGAGQGAGLCGDAVPPPPGAAGTQVVQLYPALLWRAGGAEHAHSGHGSGRDEAGHDPGL